VETLIVIFVNSSSKGFSWPNMKKFYFSVLTANSRYLQSAALKVSVLRLFIPGWNRMATGALLCKTVYQEKTIVYPGSKVLDVLD